MKFDAEEFMKSLLSSAYRTTCDVPKLDGKTNYKRWRAEMKIFLKAHYLDFTDIELDDELKEGDTEEEELKAELIEAYDSLALWRIRQAIDDASILRMIANATATKQAWDILEEAFKDEEKNNLLALNEEFRLLDMQESESLSSYFIRLMGIKAEMGLNGYSLSDELFVQKVLDTLPEKFDPVHGGHN